MSNLAHAYSSVSHQEDVLDVDRLEASTLGEASLREEILVLFFKQVESVITLLRTAQAKSDWAMVAHTLRGTALAVGAREFITIADEWEVQARADDAVEEMTMVRRLLHARARLALALETTGPSRH
jgi:HPt (histidine-containing phosphotransfer) domain-containing protein